MTFSVIFDYPEKNDAIMIPFMDTAVIYAQMDNTNSGRIWIASQLLKNYDTNSNTSPDEHNYGTGRSPYDAAWPVTVNVLHERINRIYRIQV